MCECVTVEKYDKECRVYTLDVEKDGPLGSSIGRLQNLADLECFDIQSLPSSIAKLQNLKTLTIESAIIEKLPKAIGYLANLTELDLSECPLLYCLSPSIRRLQNLEELDLNSAKALSNLPEEIGRILTKSQLCD